MDSHPDLWEGPPFTASYKWQQHIIWRGSLPSLKGSTKSPTTNQENLTMKNRNGKKKAMEKKTLDWNALWIYTFEHVLKICGTGMASSIDKEQQKQVHHSPQGGKAQLAHFATAPGVYLIHHTFSLPLKTSSIATWQGEPWVPEDLTSPPIWHTCTGGTGALSALGNCARQVPPRTIRGKIHSSPTWTFHLKQRIPQNYQRNLCLWNKCIS